VRVLPHIDTLISEKCSESMLYQSFITSVKQNPKSPASDVDRPRPSRKSSRRNQRFSPDSVCSINSVLFRWINFPTTDHSSQRSLISNIFDYVTEKLAHSHAAMNSTTESRSNEESMAMLRSRAQHKLVQISAGLSSEQE
jgi:hypothetical protein